METSKEYFFDLTKFYQLYVAYFNCAMNQK